jgi:hypothetical protein
MPRGLNCACMRSNSPRNTWPLESLRDDCVCLLEASGRSRYPGWDSPDEADATPAIEAARRIRSAIRERTASDSEA